MNFNTTNWSTFTRPDGLCNLLNGFGIVIATFNDWQQAEFVANLAQEAILNTEIISKHEDTIADLESEKEFAEKKIKDLEERTENDHRTIVELEKEIDELKTKLYNLTNE